MTKYIISTYKSAIPHIVDTDHNFLDYPLCIYIDEMYYKGSFYHDNGSVNIKTFINTKKPIYIKFRDSTTLQTPRGLYKLTEHAYKELMDNKMKPDYFQLYNQNCFNNNVTIVEPKDFDEAMQHIKNGQLITTIFINEMVDKGLMLTEDGKVVSVEEGHACNDCCKSHHPEYLQHLWDTHEINAKTIMALHNYKRFHDIALKINKDL